DKGLHFTLQVSGTSFAFVAYAPQDEDKPAKWLGSVEFSGQRHFARLERTDLTELDPKRSVRQDPGLEAWGKAMRIEDAQERETALKELVDKNAGQLLAYRVGVELLGVMARNHAAEADAQTQAAKAFKVAAAYGPEMKVQAAQQLAKQLVSSEKLASLALD